jgi:hypothetical protein
LRVWHQIYGYFFIEKNGAWHFFMLLACYFFYLFDFFDFAVKNSEGRAGGVAEDLPPGAAGLERRGAGRRPGARRPPFW